MTVTIWEPPVGALGIDTVTFAFDGTITARMRTGETVPVTLPAGWACQVVGSAAVVFRCPCGALVLGAPVHEHDPVMLALANAPVAEPLSAAEQRALAEADADPRPYIPHADVVAMVERGRCAECDGRGWHVGECHPRETCGVCSGSGWARP